MFPAFAKATRIDASKVNFKNIDIRVRETLLARGEVDAVMGFDSSVWFNLKALDQCHRLLVDRQREQHEAARTRAAAVPMRNTGANICGFAVLDADVGQLADGAVEHILGGFQRHLEAALNHGIGMIVEA